MHGRDAWQCHLRKHRPGRMLSCSVEKTLNDGSNKPMLIPLSREHLTFGVIIQNIFYHNPACLCALQNAKDKGTYEKKAR